MILVSKYLSAFTALNCYWQHYGCGFRKVQLNCVLLPMFQEILLLPFLPKPSFPLEQGFDNSCLVLNELLQGNCSALWNPPGRLSHARVQHPNY